MIVLSSYWGVMTRNRLNVCASFLLPLAKIWTMKRARWLYWEHYSYWTSWYQSYCHSVLLFRLWAVKVTLSNITYYHLKFPGIVESSTGKQNKNKLKSCTFISPNSDPFIHKEVMVKLSVWSLKTLSPVVEKGDQSYTGIVPGVWDECRLFRVYINFDGFLLNFK